ncbi:PREDICTED: uncharacterized protein LOC108370838 [Rhagoletis zephyria]|uniref:uncharacterized protein LOC108370838 n=1 Tax=Rhagoletis zephyria TaxID=28612 RepID=UPI0008119A57|nr:PREDICTED: uncharacterized protein LOC108370838 [Rhagoletis zephyria]
MPIEMKDGGLPGGAAEAGSPAAATVPPANTIAVVYARLPIPPMSSTNIEAWFTSMDFWFAASGITAEKQKTATVLAALDPNVLAQLGDVIASLPQNDRFEYVRQRIIEHFADSEQRRLNRVLSELPLGDKKPSELFFEIKRVAGNTLGDTALKSLWIKRLPEFAQAVVAASSGSATEFTKTADTIVDAIAPLQVNRVKSTPQNEVNELRAFVMELDKKLEKFAIRSRSRNRGRSSSRPRANARNNSQTTANSQETSSVAAQDCWYHQKYGSDARKCRTPCRRRNHVVRAVDSASDAL